MHCREILFTPLCTPKGYGCPICCQFLCATYGLVSDDYSYYNCVFTETRVIAGHSPVGGVASLGDDVFVMRYNSQQVEVYDAVTLTLQRHIAVPGIGPHSYDLETCAADNSLLLSDYYNDSVHRVELSGSNTAMKWSVARYPIGLSVNSSNQVVVVSECECVLEIYTTRGILLQRTRLPLGQPNHAVQVITNLFVICDQGKDKVCLVGPDGHVLRSFDGKSSTIGEMNDPRGITVDGHGHVLVADKANRRLLVLDQLLTDAQEMTVSVDGGLMDPRSVWYDRSRRRLYIGEADGHRVIVIDNLKDFSTN